MKKRVARYHDGWPSESGRALGIAAKTPKLCSCWMCGNRRRVWNEGPIQEKRFEQGADLDTANGWFA